jgi:hypothetical protein
MRGTRGTFSFEICVVNDFLKDLEKPTALKLLVADEKYAIEWCFGACDLYT